MFLWKGAVCCGRPSGEYLTRHGQGMVIIGEAEDNDQAVEQVLLEQPDVVVIDLDPYENPGRECVERVREAVPDTSIIVVTSERIDWMKTRKIEKGSYGVIGRAHLATSLVELIESQVGAPGDAATS